MFTMYMHKVFRVKYSLHHKIKIDAEVKDDRIIQSLYFMFTLQQAYFHVKSEKKTQKKYNELYNLYGVLTSKLVFSGS